MYQFTRKPDPRLAGYSHYSAEGIAAELRTLQRVAASRLPAIYLFSEEVEEGGFVAQVTSNGGAMPATAEIKDHV